MPSKLITMTDLLADAESSDTLGYAHREYIRKADEEWVTRADIAFNKATHLHQTLQEAANATPSDIPYKTPSTGGADSI